MADRDDLIRERAYQMWEEQGCPDGLAADHWYAAEQVHTVDFGRA